VAQSSLETTGLHALWRKRPTRYRFSLGDQTESSLQFLIQTCYESRTVLPEIVGPVESPPANAATLGGTSGGDAAQVSSATFGDAAPAPTALTPPSVEDGPVCVWGQYLEAEVPTDPYTQHGIYGTCAALQVLSLRRIENSLPLIVRALTTLPGLEGGGADSQRARSIREKYVLKGDKDTTYKSAALLDVALGLSPCDRRVVPPRGGGPSRSVVSPTQSIEGLLNMCLPDGGWPDYKAAIGLPLPPNPHATAVALLSLSRCTIEEYAACTGAQDKVWQCLERTCSYLLSLEIRKQSVSTLSMILTALENFAAILPGRLKATGTDYARTLAACRGEITGWIRYTSSRECLRSLEALDYRSMEMEKKGGGKRYQFLYYLPHLLAAIAVLSSASMRRGRNNRQFMKHVVEHFIDAAQETRGEVVPGGRQRVSAVETMWAARLMDSFAEHYWRQRRGLRSRAWAAALEGFDTFMNPKVVPVVAGTIVAAGVSTVAWWLATPKDQSAQFWWSLFATSLVSLVSAVALGWIVSQKQHI
jgi:hypothetical protein